MNMNCQNGDQVFNGTLKQLQQALIENQQYYYGFQQNEASRLFKFNLHDNTYFKVFLREKYSVLYGVNNDYIISGDGKVIYEYDNDTIVSATFSNNKGEIIFTTNQHEIEALLNKQTGNKFNRSKNTRPELLSLEEENNDKNSQSCYSEGSNAFNYEKNDKEEANNEEQYNGNFNDFDEFDNPKSLYDKEKEKKTDTEKEELEDNNDREEKKSEKELKDIQRKINNIYSNNNPQGINNSTIFDKKYYNNSLKLEGQEKYQQTKPHP